MLVYVEATKPQPINWFPSYHNTDKIPNGTYILYNLLKDNYEIQEVSEPPYEALHDSTLVGTYIFINDRIDFDKTEFEKLFQWVEKGNTAFVSANFQGLRLTDSLKLETEIDWSSQTIGSQPLLNLVNKALKTNTPTHVEREMEVRYFEEIDTLSHTVLGVSQIYNDSLNITNPNPNFIKAPIGKGTFYIHLQPEIFTNFFLLSNENATHTKNVLSYINDGSKLLWDNHYKSGKPVNISPLYILLNNKYLKWAYYFVLIGALLFILFEGKRKQRSIPILKPLTNKTYEYTRTISGLYLDTKENHEIAKKQIILFMEFVRTRLRVATEKIDSGFYNTVSARSGNSLEDTTDLFTFIEKVQHRHTTSKEELLKLYHDITAYKKKTDGKS